MTNDHLQQRILDYVIDRQCRKGGFCFYKLEETNGLDTYSALSLLNLLDVSFKDEKTVAYLQNMQNDDGSYDSVFLAFYSLKSLRLLNQESRHDPRPYILKHIRYDRVDAEKLPAEITSVFKRMVFWSIFMSPIKESRINLLKIISRILFCIFIMRIRGLATVNQRSAKRQRH